MRQVPQPLPDRFETGLIGPGNVLPERRLHDARHTAATVLAILAVPTPTAMAIMGWSSAEMAARYQHVLDSIRKGVADQVGDLLWDVPSGDGHDDEARNGELFKDPRKEY